ncbi:MAG TPA: hypothetical protein DEO95_04280 [Ruminococcaceae bacterium]|nr:hypothetical protein [Oscillospiraceae bacterium]
MVMAFLPTAILNVLSWCVIIGLAATMWIVPSMIGLGIMLMVIAGACNILALIGAYRLYDNVLLLRESDPEQWCDRMRKIARHCSGRIKTLVLLELSEGLCTYEKTEETREILRQLKPRIYKSGSARLRFRYLMMAVRVKALRHDTKELRPLLVQLYSCLNVRSDWSKKALNESRKLFEREMLRLRFYSKSAEALQTTERPLTLAWQQMMREELERRCREEDESDWEMLSDGYNVGLTFLLLGDEAAAVRYYRYVLSAPYTCPLRYRMEQYLHTLQPEILLRTIT